MKTNTKTLLVSDVEIEVELLDNLCDVEVGKCFVMGEPFQAPKHKKGVKTKWTRVYTKKEKGICYSFRVEAKDNGFGEFEVVADQRRLTDLLFELTQIGEKYIVFDPKHKIFFKQFESDKGGYFLNSKEEKEKEVVDIAQKWLSLAVPTRDRIAKKYGYSTGRTIDRWVNSKEIGRLKRLDLILKEELKMENKKAI